MRYQPQGLVRIDRGNRLGAKVIENVPLAGQIYTAVSQKQLTWGAGATKAIGPRGYNLRASGSAPRASFPLDLSQYSQITIAFWLYWDGYANDDAFAMEFTANTNNSAGGFYLDPNSGANGGTWAVISNGSGASGTGGVYPRPTAGAWHRFAITINIVDQTNMLYVDGVQMPFTQTSPSPGAGTRFANSVLHLFSRNETGLFGTGNMECVTIYRGALSQAEVSEDFRNPYQIYAANDDDDDYLPGRAPGAALAGSASSIASAYGSLSTSVSLSGSAQVISTSTGVLNTAIPLSGAAQIASQATGALSSAIAFAGVAQAQASSSGALSTAAALSGMAAASSTASGALSSVIALAGSAQSVALMSGSLAGTATLLSASAQVSSSAFGALSTAIQLSGYAGARASVSADLRTSIALRGAASVSAIVRGALSNAAGGGIIDVSQISPARIVPFEGSGSRVVRFEGSGSRVVVFDVPER